VAIQKVARRTCGLGFASGLRPSQQRPRRSTQPDFRLPSSFEQCTATVPVQFGREVTV